MEGRLKAPGTVPRILGYVAQITFYVPDEIARRLRRDAKRAGKRRRAGKPIGANDMLIAATILAHRATLVTRDGDDFLRVPGLRVEIW